MTVVAFDADGTVAAYVAAFGPEAPATDVAEVEAIVASFEFEVP